MVEAAPFIARDPKTLAFVERVRRSASVPSTVLVLGETGAGKGVVARALHGWSARAARPFVSVSCGAIPESLLESELFGHERGAFTGAQARRMGKFELAHTGTLFLDEVENAPMMMQVDLLRVLQERSFERVGGNETIPVDVRLVAASNRDLREEVVRGRFREDLLFRLGVVLLEVPALRDRRQDILPLARHFLARLAALRGSGPTELGEGACRDLLRHDWPGNVRELEHTIERSSVFASGGVLEQVTLLDVRREPSAAGQAAPAEAAEPAIDCSLTIEEARRRAQESLDRRYLAAVLARFAGDVRRASAHAGLSRRGLYYLLAKYGLDAAAFRAGSVAALDVAPACTPAAPAAPPPAPSAGILAAISTHDSISNWHVN